MPTLDPVGRKLRTSALAALLLMGCAGVLKAAGYPPNPTRAEPPPGLPVSALAVGATAPTFSLPTSGGGSWSLAQFLGRGPVVLVFYRGSW